MQLSVLGTKEVIEISASMMRTQFPEWEWFQLRENDFHEENNKSDIQEVEKEWGDYSAITGRSLG